MKLNDFFQEQKKQGLSDIDKLELYQKFLYKKNQWSPIKRFSFIHARSFVYSVITTILIIGTYGVYFFNTSTDSPRFTIHSNQNYAQADYIAKVVDFDGKFSIEHQGEILQTENIRNGDSILLKSGSEMVFEINSGTKSKIIGPAKLTLQQISQTQETKYRINLIYGDFIEVEGNTTKQNVELSVNDMLIKQANQDKPINYQFMNNGKNHIIKNNGSPLLVSKNGNKKETQINNKQVLAMQNNDITLFKDWETFTMEIKKGNISQTFALNINKKITTQTQESSGAKEEESPMSFMALLRNSEEDVTETNESISKNIATLIDNNKQILNPEQNNKLRGTLNSSFLIEDISSAYIGRVEGDKTKYDGSLKKIENKIQQIYTTFGLTYPGKLSESITKLKTNIEAEYDIPPKYLHNLLAINAWIKKITNTGFGSIPNGGTQAREEVFQKRSNELSLQ